MPTSNAVAATDAALDNLPAHLDDDLYALLHAWGREVRAASRRTPPIDPRAVLDWAGDAR